MKLPWVSRETFANALAGAEKHAAYVSELYHEEAQRHDATRAELSRVTDKLAQIAVAVAAPIAPPSAQSVPQGLAAVVSDTIDEIAEGDTNLRAILRKRAVAWRKRYPALTDEALAECLRTNALPSSAVDVEAVA